MGDVPSWDHDVLQEGRGRPELRAAKHYHPNMRAGRRSDVSPGLASATASAAVAAADATASAAVATADAVFPSATASAAAMF